MAPRTPRRLPFLGPLLGLHVLTDGNTAGFPLILFCKEGRPPDWYVKPIDALVSAAGHRLGLRGEITTEDNGSGDRLGNYLLVLCTAVASVVGTALWSALDRERPHYRRALDRLRVVVRYTLAGTMLTYGLAKVLPTQFPLPGPARLLEPYGASSPMGLLWTFMGASPAYTMFAGWSETSGALLLFWRRTTTIGALVLVAVLANVVMLNLCYDVPVKLESAHLLLMAMFLAAPQVGRLTDVFVRNRTARAEDLGTPPWSEGSPRARRARAVVKLALIAASIAAPAWDVERVYFQHDDGAPGSLIDGAYAVSELRRDGETAPPLLSDGRYWRSLVVRRGFARVIRIDGSRPLFKFDYDPASARGTLNADQGATGTLSLTRLGSGDIELEGTLDGARVTAHARPVDPRGVLLLQRGFHWVSDEPFNR